MAAVTAAAAAVAAMTCQRAGADLVGRAHVDAIDLAVGGNRLKVDDARREDDGQLRCSERAGERTKAADAARVAVGREGWAHFDHVAMDEYRGGVFLAERNSDRS